MSTIKTDDPRTALSPNLKAAVKDLKDLKDLTKSGKAMKAVLKALARAPAPSQREQLRQRLDSLSPAQRELLLLRLDKRAAESPEAQVSRRPELRAGPRGPSTEIPLSFAQERMWFLECMKPGDPARILCGALRLHGPLRADALQTTLDALLARHDPFRATILKVGGGRPIQLIRPPAPLPLRRFDLSTLPPEERERERERIYLEDSRAAFDLSEGPLLRASLVRVADEDHMLILAMHHIAADGWSIAVVMRELQQLYAATLEGRDSPLAPLSVHYGDFARWQRERLDADAMERELSYWRERLADLPAPLELEPDRRPASGGSSRGGSCSMRMNASLHAALEQLARERQTSLFSTLLCGFMLLLSRLTDREDIIVGLPVSGRNRVETEAMVGLFINTLVLRTKLSPQDSFRANLDRVRQAFLESLEHVEVPIDRLVQELAPERAGSGNPLYETVFNFTPQQTRRIELPGFEAHFEDAPIKGAKFSMELFVTEFEDGFELEIVFPSERYDAARMQAFLAQYQALLSEACRHPELACAQFDLSPVDDRGPRASEEAAPEDYENLVHTIALHVRESGELTALERGDAKLDYSQLGAAMAVVADQLEALELGPGDVVAIAGPRSMTVISAMAGVLLRRCVLLTLSPALPLERRLAMCREAGARALLHIHSDDLTEALREVDGIELVDLDTLPPSSDAFALHLERVPLLAGRDDPAYVFFTSGSTGVPKGVLGTSAGLAHFLTWQRATFDLGPGDRCAQLTGLSFDVVLRDVFLVLSAGGTLVLPEDPDDQAGTRALQWLAERSITVAHTVPSVLAAWLRGSSQSRVDSMRWLFSAGEPLSASLVERWRERCSGEVINLYGPTETSLAKFCYPVPRPAPEGTQALGHPLPHTSVEILDDQRRRCALGEAGEIAIRTPFRSLGYINAPDEQSRHFVPDPWSKQPKAQLYLTGDRGVLGADGVLRILGRIDHQVKIRGVRVEPSEVAAVLDTHPAVDCSAVVARNERDDGPLLVAYIVPASVQGPLDIAALEDHLRRSLPGPMIPSAFVELDELPLNANNKLDRSRLPAPSAQRTRTRSHVDPRNETELELLDIWGQLLETEDIGVTDNFFELGGHSLLALHLVSDIEDRLGIRVQLNAFFEGPTIAKLALLIREDRPAPALVTLSRGDGSPLFLIHPGGGILWNYLPLARRLQGQLSLLGIQARGIDDDEPPRDDILSMARDYVEIITEAQPEGPLRLAGHSLGGVIVAQMANLLVDAGREVQFAALFDTVLAADRSLEPSEQLVRDAASLIEMVSVIERFHGRSTGLKVDDLLDLSAEGQFDRVVAALVEVDALTAGSGVDQVRRLLNVSKAQVLARRSHEPQPSKVPLLLFRAEDAEHQLDDPALGWAAIAEVELRTVPGDHVTMMKEPNVGVLAEALRVALKC